MAICSLQYVLRHLCRFTKDVPSHSGRPTSADVHQRRFVVHQRHSITQRAPNVSRCSPETLCCSPETLHHTAGAWRQQMFTRDVPSHSGRPTSADVHQRRSITQRAPDVSRCSPETLCCSPQTFHHTAGARRQHMLTRDAQSHSGRPTSDVHERRSMTFHRRQHMFTRDALLFTRDAPSHSGRPTSADVFYHHI